MTSTGTVQGNLGNVSALLFDLGGVVIDIDFNRAFAHWLPMSRLSLAGLKSAFTFDVTCNWISPSGATSFRVRSDLLS